MDQIGRQVVRKVQEVVRFDRATGQLQQGRRIVGHVLDEAHNQRVATKTELVQMHQAEDLTREEGQQVVMKTEREQGVQSERHNIRVLIRSST